jgi:hypothetical protein
LPFPFICLRTLSFSVSCNSFVCHSYENTGGVPQLFPFWNSPLTSGTFRSTTVSTWRRSDLRRFHRLDQSPTYLFSFHTLPHSFAFIKNLTLLFSSDFTLFGKNTRGGGAYSKPTRRSEWLQGSAAGIPTCRASRQPAPIRSGLRVTSHQSPSSPIAASLSWCNNGQRRENSSPPGETTTLLPVSKTRERTSGTAPSCSPLQVVPGSSVLHLDRSAGWPANQRRVGKAGSVRLG